MVAIDAPGAENERRTDRSRRALSAAQLNTVHRRSRGPLESFKAVPGHPESMPVRGNTRGPRPLAASAEVRGADIVSQSRRTAEPFRRGRRRAGASGARATRRPVQRRAPGRRAADRGSRARGPGLRRARAESRSRFAAADDELADDELVRRTRERRDRPSGDISHNRNGVYGGSRKPQQLAVQERARQPPSRERS